MPDPAKPPIFIFGVPRSGTTLLRTLLDSHPNIACGPETPWLGAHQPRSVMELVRFLSDDKHGYCASYGMDRAVVTEAARRFVSALLDEYAKSKGKHRWAEKTPDNVLYVDFLLELFPDAKVIWLTRNPLDVAVSTSTVAEHRQGISRFLEQHISFGPGTPPVANNPFNAVLRWRHWTGLLSRSLRDREHLKVGYERLVTEPESTLGEVCTFLGEAFDPQMLRYAERPHEFPAWEWGSADVKAHGALRTDRAGRWKRELGPFEQAVLTPLASLTGEINPTDLPEEPLFTYLRGLSDSFKFDPGVPAESAALAWMWSNLTSRLNGNTRLYDISGKARVLAIIAAIMGARVTVALSSAKAAKHLRTLAERMRLRLDVAVLAEPRIPAPDSKADIVLAMEPEGWPDRKALIAEAERVLRPRGMLLVTGDIAGTAGRERYERP